MMHILAEVQSVKYSFLWNLLHQLELVLQVSVSSCSPGEVVLVLWSEEHTNYQVFLNTLSLSLVVLILRSRSHISHI